MEMQAQIAQYDTPDAILATGERLVAEFLGRERLVRRMSVVQIDAQTLEHPPSGAASGEPRVPLSTARCTKPSAAALSSPTERAAVFDGERYVGRSPPPLCWNRCVARARMEVGRLPRSLTSSAWAGASPAGDRGRAEGSGLTPCGRRARAGWRECAYWGCVRVETLRGR
jgi:hypothetical protein